MQLPLLLFGAITIAIATLATTTLYATITEVTAAKPASAPIHAGILEETTQRLISHINPVDMQKIACIPAYN
ncbi:hypothetical protein [Cellvibrio japonicus]|uniref:Uncharacterized protein n=1 Tax=Cellvibrio japonicus (strain Ueda107) TaxID=498211 RepID=B3PKK6_CELJU|nr:hypothetical protein [Cellvibrio japonicus]ACE83667.1 hypothetical protein CJA_2474 [Cellvibrio japonicus Ueda107]QEI12866.1 hypothetical protein FY117_11940 [Cellvibrio japonicus]QEI16440.1 hypothetical protein FY116_11945 [Cellvibrio japonicus]QEI20018.1 hypothetical protein FY115_11940 [Cellvibrio japonicus]